MTVIAGAVWLDLRNKRTELYVSKSSDSGLTWSKNELLYPIAREEYLPSVAILRSLLADKVCIRCFAIRCVAIAICIRFRQLISGTLRLAKPCV